LLDATRSLVDAAGRSSDAVLAALAAALRRVDERFESVMIFAPAGDELACAYADGARIA